MPKPATVRWKARRRGGRSKSERRAGLPRKEALALAAVIALMGAPWLLMPQGDAPASGAHRVELRRTAHGYAAPFGRGRLELRFVRADGEVRARLDLFAADGARAEFGAGSHVHLETPAQGGARVRVPLRPIDGSLVSVTVIEDLPDRSTLVVDEGGFRHVFALDGNPGR